MFKKALLLLAMTFGLMSTLSADIPFPTCPPCDDVNVSNR